MSAETFGSTVVAVSPPLERGASVTTKARRSVPSDLSLWKDRAAKAAIVGFVESVSQPGPAYVPVARRIATFDNDGTLWCEKPMYPQADFLIRRWADQVAADPARARNQPWKAVAEHDRTWLAAALDHVPDLIRGVTQAYEGITVDAFDQEVRSFFHCARHPTFNALYTELGYGPMRELIDYLGAHGFACFICSAGGRDFVRVVADAMYGVPRERVIGSGVTLEYRSGAVYRTGGVEQPVDDGPGKPVHVWSRTGYAPLFAGGNADGDIELLESAAFAMLVHHDDGTREFAYDDGAEQALARAARHDWTVVSMRDDFATVF
jgi:phosphoserine phosphatase